LDILCEPSVENVVEEKAQTILCDDVPENRVKRDGRDRDVERGLMPVNETVCRHLGPSMRNLVVGGRKRKARRTGPGNAESLSGSFLTELTHPQRW
jgi:hypothetical protein